MGQWRRRRTHTRRHSEVATGLESFQGRRSATVKHPRKFPPALTDSLLVCMRWMETSPFFPMDILRASSPPDGSDYPWNRRSIFYSTLRHSESSVMSMIAAMSAPSPCGTFPHHEMFGLDTNEGGDEPKAMKAAGQLQRTGMNNERRITKITTVTSRITIPLITVIVPTGNARMPTGDYRCRDIDVSGHAFTM